MKKLLLFFLILATSVSFSQQIKVDAQMIEMGWNFVSPFVLKKVEDPLTKEIIAKALPKIIKEDIKGTAYEIGDAIFRVKNVKVLNKEFLTLQEKSIETAVKAVRKKDYATAVNEVISIVTISDKYIRTGILEKEELKAAVSDSIGVLKASLIKKEEINGKVFIEKNSKYFFFVPNGYVNELPTKDSSLVKFQLKSEEGGEFEIGIINQEVNDEKFSVDYFESNPDEKKRLQESISSKTLKSLFGDGMPSPASLVNTSNFKAYKFPYLANSDVSMTASFVTFHNSRMYIIYFKSPQTEFFKASKYFEDQINSFFFGRTIPYCELKNQGVVTVVNKSTNPYDFYQDGVLISTLKGKSSTKLYVKLGTTNFQAVQKTGYMLYPTQNNRMVKIISACQESKIEIGFEDPR